MSKLNSYVVVLLALGSAAWAQGADLGKFQAILDKKPFGEEAKIPVVVAPNPAQVAADALARELKMTAIIETDSGLQVGIQNTKTQKSYLLFVGDSEDGIDVLDADYKGEKAKIRVGTLMTPSRTASWMASGMLADEALPTCSMLK